MTIMTKNRMFLTAIIVLFTGIGVRAEEAPPGEALAWIRFEKAAESYAGTPYIFLGKQQIDLKIDVSPAPGQVIDLLWGSKGDARTALIVINGKSEKVEAGVFGVNVIGNLTSIINTFGESGFAGLVALLVLVGLFRK